MRLSDMFSRMCGSRGRHRLSGPAAAALALALALPLSVAQPALAQDLIPFTPSSSAGTVYVESPRGAEAEDEGGLSINLRLSESFRDYDGAGATGFAGTGDDRSMVTGGAIVDVYPFSSGLRVSGGLRFGRTEDAPGAFTVRGDSYPAMLVTAPNGPDVDGPTPYVGVGYGTSFFDGTIDLSIDAGALTAVPGGDGLAVNDRDGGAGPDVGNFLPMVGVSATYRF